AERLAEDPVEVLDERARFRAQIVKRGEARPLEETAGQDREPNLDLVEPRAVTWCVDESNAVGAGLQKFPTGLLRLENALLALDAKVILNATALGDQFDQLGRAVRVELVHHEEPASCGVGVDGARDVRDEVHLGASWADRWADDLARHDVEVRDQ